jgi:hypothetical protein
MPDTSRIQSGFDAELQLGRLWFLTAIQALIDNGVINLPNGIAITDAQIIDNPDWDLELQTSIGVMVKAKMEIRDNKFVFTTDLGNIHFEIKMPNFGKLAAPPLLQKVIGSNGYENAMSLLFNLDIRACPQNQDPLPAGEHMERGNPDHALSFLPVGQHIALGLARESFQRFANNIWHTELRDEDGSHPLPKPGEKKKGDWKRVKVSVTKERIKFTLEGEVPIDLWPDADVTLAMELKPKLVNGKLTFAIDTDLDVDTGFWGDVLAFTIGALAGFLIAIFTGGLLLIPAVGLGAVIILEVAEYIVGEVIERRIVAKDINGQQLTYQTCSEEIIKLAFPRPSKDGISIGALDSIPTSIPVLSDTDDSLYTRTVVVAADYDEITLDGKGLAIAGKSQLAELLEPQAARLVESIYEQDELKKLKYRVPSSGDEVTLDLSEVIGRLGENELKPPVRAESNPDNSVLDIPSGKLCCPCLIPTHIRRKDTIITHVKFSTGLELKVSDAVMLQDNAGVYLKGLQLIHPVNANPYFRAPANTTKADNFEELPGF